MLSDFCSRFVVAAASGLVIFSSSVAASAYCRTTTCDPSTEDCKVDLHGCYSAGVPLFWSNMCVGYSLQQDGSPHIDFQTVTQIAKESFGAWTAVSCSGQSPAIQVSDFGSVPCDATEFNFYAGNDNIVVFRTGTWPHSNAAATIALTTVTFDSNTGEIYDADMEINDGPQLAHAKITASDSNVGYDLQSVITHEAGHFYGLAHSTVQAATMQAYYVPSSTWMRDLSADDISGICTIYPSTRSYGACDPTPRRGLQTTCGDGSPETTKSCCASSTAPGRPSSGSLSSLAVLAFGVAVALLRRSKS